MAKHLDKFTRAFRDSRIPFLLAEIITDGEGEMVDVACRFINGPAAALLGLPAEDLHRQRFTRVFPAAALEALDASADRMGELAEKLELLDEGFEAVYDRIRQELIDNKSAYRQEIRRMQELIAVITEKVVGINAARMRNKTQAENQFKKSRQQIGRATSKMKASQNYYNSMNRLNFVDPQFYDNKK